MHANWLPAQPTTEKCNGSGTYLVPGVFGPLGASWSLGASRAPSGVLWMLPGSHLGAQRLSPACLLGASSVRNPHPGFQLLQYSRNPQGARVLVLGEDFSRKRIPPPCLFLQDSSARTPPPPPGIQLPRVPPPGFLQDASSKNSPPGFLLQDSSSKNPSPKNFPKNPPLGSLLQDSSSRIPPLAFLLQDYSYFCTVWVRLLGSYVYIYASKNGLLHSSNRWMK